jgi:hypothetical protein
MRVSKVQALEGYVQRKAPSQKENDTGYDPL